MSLQAPDADRMTSLMDMGLASLCSLWTASAAGFGVTSVGGAEAPWAGFCGVAVSDEKVEVFFADFAGGGHNLFLG